MDYQKLKQNALRQAEENPLLALGVFAGAITALSKFLDATSAVQGRRAYAKQVNHSVKKNKRR